MSERVLIVYYILYVVEFVAYERTWLNGDVYYYYRYSYGFIPVSFNPYWQVTSTIETHARSLCAVSVLTTERNRLFPTVPKQTIGFNPHGQRLALINPFRDNPSYG